MLRMWHIGSIHLYVSNLKELRISTLLYWRIVIIWELNMWQGWCTQISFSHEELLNYYLPKTKCVELCTLSEVWTCCEKSSLYKIFNMSISISSEGCFEHNNCDLLQLRSTRLKYILNDESNILYRKRFCKSLQKNYWRTDLTAASFLWRDTLYRHSFGDFVYVKLKHAKDWSLSDYYFWGYCSFCAAFASKYVFPRTSTRSKWMKIFFGTWNRKFRVHRSTKRIKSDEIPRKRHGVI